MAYSTIRGPLGPQRDDHLNAKAIRETWCIAVPSQASTIRPANYLLFEEAPPPPRQSEELQMAIAQGLSAAFAERNKI
jgi:hypothetical protein